MLMPMSRIIRRAPNAAAAEFLLDPRPMAEHVLLVLPPRGPQLPHAPRKLLPREVNDDAMSSPVPALEVPPERKLDPVTIDVWLLARHGFSVAKPESARFHARAFAFSASLSCLIRAPLWMRRSAGLAGARRW